MFNHSFTSTLRSRAGFFLLASSIAVATIAVTGLTESPVNAAPVSFGNLMADRTLDPNGTLNVYPGEEIIMSGSAQINFGSDSTCLGVELQTGDVITMTESNLGFDGDFNFYFSVGQENGQATGSSYTLPAGITYLTLYPPQVRRTITSAGTLTFYPKIKVMRGAVTVVETANCVNPYVSATIDAGSSYDLSSYVAREGDRRLVFYGEACVDMTLVEPGDVLTYAYELQTGGQDVDPQGATPNYRWDQPMDGDYPGNRITNPEPTRLKLNIDGASGPNPIAGNTYTFSLDIKKGNDSVAISCPVNNPGGGGGGGPMPRLYPTGQVSLAGQLTLGSTLTVSLPSWSLTDGGPAIANTDISAPDIKWILCSVGPDAQRTDIANPMPQCLTPPNSPLLLLANGTFGMPNGPGQTFSGSSLTITQPLLTALDGKYLMVDVFLETTPAPGQMMGVFYAFNFKSCAPGENCADSFGNTSAPDTSAPDTSAPATTAAPTTAAPTTTTSTTITPSSSTTTVPPPALATVRALPVAPTPIIADATITTSEEITVTFGGFTPFEFVQLIVASTPQVMGSGYADAQGVVTLRGSLPNNLASGNHTLAVFAPASGIGFTQPIIVSRPLLPITGSDSPNDLFAIAMILFVLGIVVRRTSTAITNK